jgi:hypothetical protein
MLSFVCTPSWFAPNISLHRMSPTCVFICQCSRGICFVLSLWICSCVVWWKHCPNFSSLLSSSSPLSFIVFLLPLPHGFSPVYITEHIPRYDFIEKFIKLPFQRVFIHLNRSSYEGAMAVSLQLCLLSKSGRVTIGDSAISTCRNLWLTWFLTCWKCNFVGLLNIQDILLFFPWGCAKLDANRSFEDVDGLDLVILGAPWLLPMPIARANYSPQNIHLKILIDTLT